MKVIEYEPQFWFFLTDGNEHYIDVNCNYSFVGFGRLYPSPSSLRVEVHVYLSDCQQFEKSVEALKVSNQKATSIIRLSEMETNGVYCKMSYPKYLPSPV